ncbi:MAG TPA: hypothetical protein VLG46_17495, partial [Anaerolineae bacterium]|nr:hypothetical protein [Anaerolineae bacterium]
TREQVEALGGQIALGGRLLWRLVERILDEPEPPSLYGLSAHWSLVRRPIVKRVVASRELLHLLRTALRQVPTDLPRGEAAVLMGMKAARAWEFERCFVLLDGIDTHTRRRDTSFMFELLAPILNALSYWEQQQMWFKLFLPDELYQRVSETLQRLASNLTSSSITSIMEQWQPEDFHRLLVERFRVAGSRRVGFDDLTAPAMPDSLDRVLFWAAQGSPRRLLQIISGLIDAHAARDPHDRLFSPADWSAMQAQWNGEPPAPPALNPT